MAGRSVLPPPLNAQALHWVYHTLLTAYGPRQWWPARNDFEIMVGAILTQNTAWTNVQRALDNLYAANAMDPQRILAANLDDLAAWLRPSGYFNLKAKRLRAYCRWYVDSGGKLALSALATDQLRQRLLGVYGIGPETADDILLYVFERPVFVIDRYTQRLFQRLGLIAAPLPYEVLRAAVEQALAPDAALFNEFHAQIDGHAGRFCRTSPRCTGCVLAARCPSRIG